MAVIAARLEVARSTVTRAARGPLASAVLEDGRIDLRHPAALEWLAARDADLSDFDVLTPRPSAEVAGELGASAAVPLADLESMTLRQITDLHGSDIRFHGWIRARKELAMARRGELQLERYGGMLIAKSRVAHLFDLVDQVHRRLLRDVPTRLATRFASGPARERIVTEIRETISSVLRATTSAMSISLRAEDPTAPLHAPPARKKSP